MPKLRETPNTSTSEVFSLRTNREQLSALDDLAAFLTARGEGANESGGVVTRQAAARRALTAGVRALRAESEAPAPVDELRGLAVLRALADLDPGVVRALVAALQSSTPAQAVAAPMPDPRQIVIPGTLPEGPANAPQSPSAARAGATSTNARDERRTGAERRKRDRRAEAARAQSGITSESVGAWFRAAGAGGRPGANAAHRVESVAGQEVRFYCGRTVPAAAHRPINPDAPGKLCAGCEAQ